MIVFSLRLLLLPLCYSRRRCCCRYLLVCLFACSMLFSVWHMCVDSLFLIYKLLFLISLKMSNIWLVECWVLQYYVIFAYMNEKKSHCYIAKSIDTNVWDSNAKIKTNSHMWLLKYALQSLHFNWTSMHTHREKNTHTQTKLYEIHQVHEWDTFRLWFWKKNSQHIFAGLRSICAKNVIV